MFLSRLFITIFFGGFRHITFQNWNIMAHLPHSSNWHVQMIEGGENNRIRWWSFLSNRHLRISCREMGEQDMLGWHAFFRWKRKRKSVSRWIKREGKKRTNLFPTSMACLTVEWPFVWASSSSSSAIVASWIRTVAFGPASTKFWVGRVSPENLQTRSLDISEDTKKMRIESYAILQPSSWEMTAP